MEEKISRLAAKMMEYEKGCPARAHHLLKVYAFSRHIALLEGLDAGTRQTLEAAALVHDIGIRPSLEKYGSAAGEYQEKEGPPAALPLLEGLGFPPEMCRRVCFLVGRHHTYHGIDGMDYQVLVEADFLVNIHEGGMGEEEIRSVREKIFRTEAGTRMLDCLFLNE